MRYIDELQKYDVDFGEADMVGENEDVVRIMSIHKSKGLEFPIVIVSGMGKNFNKQDTRSKMVLHPELGIGLDYMDGKKRIKSPTIAKKAIAKQIELENLGEELRVLYVALTRAKEKLIITGTLKDAPGKTGIFQAAGSIVCTFQRHHSDSVSDKGKCRRVSRLDTSGSAFLWGQIPGPDRGSGRACLRRSGKPVRAK